MDYFIRNGIQLLTGLTKYSSVSGSNTVLPQNTWTTIYSSSNTTVHKVLCAYKILCTNSSNHQMRILAGETGSTLEDSSKIFPFASGISFISGISSDALNVPLQIPVGYDFAIQVYTDSLTAEATLESLSIIEVPTLNYV